MKMFNVFTAFCCTVLLMAVSSCRQSETTRPNNREIIFAVSQAPLNLDPRYATDAASARVNRLLYQSLVDFDAQSKPTASLASWQEISPRLYSFTLNKNRAPFHCADKSKWALISAYDVKATYDSFAFLKDSPHAAEFDNIKNIRVKDDNTVQFELKTADSHFAAKLIIGILPAALIAQHHDFSHDPVGSGSLSLVSWQHQLSLVRERDGQKISLQEVKDPTVRVLKLLHGEVDLLQGELPVELVQYLQTKPEVIVKTNIGANFSYLGLNMQDSVLKQLKVRQALAYAIDRNVMMQKVMVANTRAAGAILPPEHYTNQYSLPIYPYKPALARQLLLEAGVKLPLKLVYKTSTDAQRVRFATIMQAQMQPAGIQLEIRSLDWGTFFEDIKQGNFQLYGLTWVGIKTPEIYEKALGSNSMPPKGFNRGRYLDAQLDQYLLNDNWQAATARINSQLPYIPLWYEGQFAVMRKQIHHFSAKPDGNWDDLATISRYAH